MRIELVGADQEIMREIAEALAENEQAWEDMRAYNIRLEERAREAECALAEMRKALSEARPYVFQRIDHGNISEQRSATAVDVLGRVDAALREGHQR